MTAPLTPYTLAQLRTFTQALIGDYNGTRFSTDQLDDAINFAIQLLCQKMSYTYREVVIPQDYQNSIPAIGDQNTNTTIAQFALIGLYPDGVTSYNYMDYIDIRKVRFGYGPLFISPWIPPLVSMALNRSALTNEDVYSPTWIAKTGIPQRWDLYDGKYIVVFPNPQHQDYSNGYIAMGYTQQPIQLTDPTDTVDIRIPYQDQQFLKYASGSWLLALDNSDTTSLETAKAYMDAFNKFLENV